MSRRSAIAMGGTFYLVFLLLTPLGLFNDWIPPLTQTGHYSITAIDPGDDTGYYAYLRSFFFDGDLDFINERKYAHNEKLTDTGYVFNNWQIGQAVLFLPFFLIGHLLAVLYGALGYPVTADGYSAPYYIATAAASGTWLFAGLILVFFILRKFADERIALVTTLSIWLGSPLLYFSFIRQRMAHTAEFFAAALVLLAWLHTRRSDNPWKHAVFGGALGLLGMVRIINVVFLALYLVDQLFLARSDSAGSAAEKGKTLFIRLAAAAGGWVLVMLPQLFCWYKINGVPLPTRHLLFAGQGLSAASAISYLEKAGSLLAGAQWGAVFSMPLVAAGCIGLLLKNDFIKDIRPGLIACVAGFAAVVVLYPEDSASYGQRHFISLLPVFALGLAALLQCCSRSRAAWVGAVTFIAVCVLAQYMMIVQYKVTLPYNHPRFTLEALGAAPQLFLDRPGILLRSTNFFRLIFMDRPDGWDFRDVLFMVIFPLSQLILIVPLLAAAGRSGRSAGKTYLPLHPKFLLGGSGFVSIVLLVIIAMGAPDKTPSELEKRRVYLSLLRQGVTLLENGRNEEARESFNRASALMPDLWNPYLHVGVTWDVQGKIPEANHYYRKGLALYPDNGPALLKLGDNLKVLGKFAEAEPVLQAALRLLPREERAYDSLAQVTVRLNRPERSRQLLRMALTIDPAYGPGHANLALVSILLKDPEGASEHMRHARRLGVRESLFTALATLYNMKRVRKSPAKQ